MKLVSFKYNDSQIISCGILEENIILDFQTRQLDFKIINSLNNKNKVHDIEFKKLSIVNFLSEFTIKLISSLLML